MAGFWEQFLPGAAGAAGTGYLFNQLNNQQGDIHDMFGEMQKGAMDRTQFQPWSVTNNIGNIGYDGEGGMKMGLKGEALDRYNQMQRNAGEMMNRASMDPTQARNDYYDQMRGAQSPEEQRQKQMMDSRLLAQGRSGIKSNAHGGTPEQLAMFKAQEENKNQAMLNADQMAQQGLMNQAQMGSGMFRDSYLPMEMMNKFAGIGQNNAQLGLQGQLAGADAYNQLGIAQATSDTNYDNMMMDFQKQMLTAANPLFQQGGSWLDRMGQPQGLPDGQQGPPNPNGQTGWEGLWENIKGWF